MSTLVARLRERKIVQWTLAYLAGAWLTLQLVDVLAGQLAWPPVVFRATLVLLSVGLLATLVLAWYHGEQGRQRVGGTELLMLVGILVIAAAGVTLVRGKSAVASADGVPSGLIPTVKASIAVFPFENLSADPDNAYFAGGIHDELLTQLAQIPGLKVISRTTMLRYEGSEKSIKEIAQELGVAAVMEGSVQRVGARVRINAQLIDAATDAHLWAERYDRDIADVFEVQSEVAKAVAAATRTALSPGQAAALAKRPTENAEAYAFYLRGIDYLGRGTTEDNLRNASQMLGRATDLDPRFAEAWAGRGRAEILLYWFGHEPSSAQLARARASVEKAYAFAPELPAVRLAVAQVRYRAREYERALELVEPLVSEMPGSAEAAMLLASVYRRQGRWEESLRLWQRAAELDPSSGLILFELGGTYEMLHRFADAEATLERSIELDPDGSANSYQALGLVYLRRGDLKAGRVALGRIPDRFAASRDLSLAWYDAAEGQYQEGLNRVANVPQDARMNGGQGLGIGATSRALTEGFLLDRLGRSAEARSRYRTAADKLEAVVGAEGFSVQGQVGFRSALGFAYAGLGLKAKAIAEAERFVRELPVSVDASAGADRLFDEAKIFAAVGEKDRAVAALRDALAHPVAATPAYLRLVPMFAPLRGYEPFERLMREVEAREAKPLEGH